MTAVDHLLILLLFVVQPVHGHLEAKRLAARTAAGESFDRVKFYRQTALVEWLFLAALATAWLFFERPVSDLGFVKPGPIVLGFGVLIVIGFAGYAFFGTRWARNASEPAVEKQVKSIGDVIQYLPHNRRDLQNFYGVSITAGIVEEIVSRGFVIWYLAQVMPTWSAVIVSSIAFGLAHSYQGPSNAFRCGLLGLVFAVLYVLSGSIWLPIIAHALLDMTQGAVLHELLQRRRDNEEPQANQPVVG